MLIDSHCHLLSSEYDNVTQEINNAFSSGISKIIINGYDLKTSLEALSIAKSTDNVYAAIGIGPENIEDYNESMLKNFDEMLKSSKVVAIGEIGLDYYWTKENKKEQIKVFKDMLSLAKKYKLPVIIHSRNAIEDTYNLLQQNKVTGIMHCYSGSLEMAKKFINLGFLIGVGGIITFKNSKKLKEIIKNIDLENISLETDSPYLTPEPNRGRKNNPSNLVYIRNEIASIKNISIEEVADITSHNVMSKFIN